MSQAINLDRIRYRVSQFWSALRNTPPDKGDLELVRSILSDTQLDLFNLMQNSEKVHALRVIQTLLDSGESHPDLLTAALLHDVGKIVHPLRLWERVFIVLGKRFLPKLSMKWSRGHPRSWTRPFVLENEHPGWGAELAQKAGASPLAVTLIRDHQNELISNDVGALERNILITLQKADNQN